MALIIGDINASSGMSKTIYDKIREVMEPIDGVTGQALEDLRNSWKKLAYAIADGVVNHIKSNMEITGIQTTGNINAAVTGNTATASSHFHNVSLSGVQNNVTFTQGNDGAGHVR